MKINSRKEKRQCIDRRAADFNAASDGATKVGAPGIVAVVGVFSNGEMFVGGSVHVAAVKGDAKKANVVGTRALADKANPHRRIARPLHAGRESPPVLIR